VLGAGDLSRRVRFDRRTLDINGDRLGDWAASVTRDAKVFALKGSEAVQAQRLEGQQPVIITVRRDSVTKTIDNTFRGVDARDTTITWDITSAIWNEADDSIELLAVQRLGGEDG